LLEPHSRSLAKVGQCLASWFHPLDLTHDNSFRSPLNNGHFLLPTITGWSSSIRHFPAWLLVPLRGKFVAFDRGACLVQHVRECARFRRDQPCDPSPEYSLVRNAETFSATARLMSWFRGTPSNSAALRNSSSKEGCSRNAKLVRLMGSHSSSPAVIRFLFATTLKPNSTRLGLQYSIFCDVLKASSIYVIALSIPGIKVISFPARG
jgi:hypothetical protein